YRSCCIGCIAKLSPVGGDTNRSVPPWAASPPPTLSTAKRQFGIHPVHCKIINNKTDYFINKFY
ncbi:MAG TPA: hypothetical protein VIJ57_05820, partial [Hanamia sp.]